MPEKFKVIGPCEVAGVAPGGIVTREQIEASGEPGTIHVDALIGPHLEPVPEPDVVKVKTTGKAE